MLGWQRIWIVLALAEELEIGFANRCCRTCNAHIVHTPIEDATRGTPQKQTETHAAPLVAMMHGFKLAFPRRAIQAHHGAGIESDVAFLKASANFPAPL
jgi:hypothetical protein